MPEKRPSTPTLERVPPECEIHTPVKIRVQAQYDFCKSRGIKGQNEAILRENGVTRSTGYRMVHESNPRNPRRMHNDPTKEETRGRKSVVTPKHIQEMERILENEGIKGLALTWAQLGYEVGLECRGRIIERAMGTMDYHKCIACQRGWVNPKTAKNRVNFSTVMLERYPLPVDWYRVRFSNECHYGWGDQQKLRIIRKPGQRYCYSCIQQRDEPAEKDRKRYHSWAESWRMELKSSVR
jgi:hypothetical protein